MDKITSDQMLARAQKDVAALLAEKWPRIEHMIEEAYEAFDEGQAPESKAQFEFNIRHSTMVRRATSGRYSTFSRLGCGFTINAATHPTPVGPDPEPQLPGTEPATEPTDGATD